MTNLRPPEVVDITPGTWDPLIWLLGETVFEI